MKEALTWLQLPFAPPIGRSRGDREPGSLTTNNGLEAINGLLKAILASGEGVRLDLMAALYKLLEVMRTMSQRSASTPAPVDPCADWEAGMTEHAQRKYAVTVGL